jgi:nucleoside-diphosphate-sugar epimerase
VTRVLVTGASGFIGRHAVDALVARGHEVVAVSSHAVEGEDRPGVRWVRCDLLAPGAAASLARAVQAPQLLHLAWYAEHGAFWASARNLDWVSDSLGLLRAFGEAGGRRAVLAGSCAEYAWGIDGPCAEATTPLAPQTLYGAAKHGLGVVADAYARQTGLSLARGRIFFCFGPGEPPGRLVPSVTRALLDGEEAPVTHGEQIRDFMAVEEVGDAFAALLDSDAEGAVNVASGEATRLRDLVAMVGRVCGRPELIRYGALPQRAADPPEIVADVGRLRTEVGWRPRESLDAGVARAVAWWSDAARRRVPGAR